MHEPQHLNIHASVLEFPFPKDLLDFLNNRFDRDYVESCSLYSQSSVALRRVRFACVRFSHSKEIELGMAAG